MTIIQLLLTATILVPAPMTRPDGWTGQIVMLKKSGVPYRTVDKKDFAEGTLLMIEYRVVKDQGENLIVVESGKDVLVSKQDMVLQADAVVYFSEQIEKTPQDALLFAFRGWAWKQLKNLDNALKDYGKAIELAPQQCAWRNNRALIWIEKKDYDKAIADYDESLKLFPQYGLAHRNRGNCWLKKKEYEKALTDFKRSVEISPENLFWKVGKSDGDLAKMGVVAMFGCQMGNRT